MTSTKPQPGVTPVSSKGKDVPADKVREWMLQQGYPMEMRVAQQFRRERFSTVQSAYYVDAETRELRETDVLASLAFSLASSVLLLVHVVVECKHVQREKPWVGLSASNQNVEDFQVFPRLASTGGLLLLNLIESKDGVRALPLFQMPKTVAYGLVEAFSKSRESWGSQKGAGKRTQSRKDKPDPAYSAIRQVLSSARSRTSWFSKDLAGDLTIVEIVLPLVVIDGPLFEAELSENGQLDIHPRDSLLLALNTFGVGGKLGESVPVTFINIIKEAGTSSFAADVRTSLKWIRDNCAAEFEVVSKAMLDRRKA